jgi:hypothetical protein
MGRTVILNDDVNTACEIAGTSRIDSDKSPFAQQTVRHLARGRAAPLWITAAILTMTWASETQASPDQARRALADAQYATAARNVDFGGTAGDGDFEALRPSRGSSDKSVRAAQATTSDTGESQQVLEQEHHRAGTPACELAIARRDVEWLQYLDPEHKRAERLEQDLAAARRDAEAQTALAAKAGDEVSRLKQGAESDAAELQKSLQQERARADRLEQDLAAVRRDVETEAALAAKAGDEASRLEQAAETGVTELRQSIQKEHERAETLAQDLSTARSKIYAYEAQVGRAGNEAAELRQAAASVAPALKSAQDERDRLEQGLATARRDVETQAALATKASEEAVRMRQAAELDSAELRCSLQQLQQERARAERLEQDLALARRNDASSRIDPTAAREVVTVGQITRDQPVEDGAKPIADRAPAAGGRGDAQPNPEAAARLVARAGVLLGQGDIGAARIVLERAADMGSAQASFALAETYDPLILAKWGTYGTRGDAIKARDLYAKADAGGIKEAKARFEALRR